MVEVKKVLAIRVTKDGLVGLRETAPASPRQIERVLNRVQDVENTSVLDLIPQGVVDKVVSRRNPQETQKRRQKLEENLAKLVDEYGMSILEVIEPNHVKHDGSIIEGRLARSRALDSE